MYQVRRVNIGKTEQLNELAHACGELYTQTLVFFWRTVRKKGIWLKPKHLMRLFTSEKLHAHTSDQGFSPCGVSLLTDGCGILLLVMS